MAWDALVGRKAKGDYYDPRTGEVFLQREEQINQEIADRLDMLDMGAVEAELQSLTLSDEPLEQWEGWGEYKKVAARAFLRVGEGELRVNGQPMWEYFGKAPRKARGFLRRLTSFDEVAELLARMEGVVWVWGSSRETMRQAKAAAHAIAKALMDYDGKLTERLTFSGFGKTKLKGKKKF
jgi:small subunit ribosomal protein S9